MNHRALDVDSYDCQTISSTQAYVSDRLAKKTISSSGTLPGSDISARASPSL